LNATQGIGLGVVALTTEGENTQIAGFGQLTLWPRCGEISDLVVHEALRGRGVGTGLVQYLCRAGRDMNLDCLEIGADVTNTRARALYQRLGFVESHTAQLEFAGSTVDVVYLRVDLR
jgi:ribosomal protein S18 acetylase RimI-like enzyme